MKVSVTHNSNEYIFTRSYWADRDIKKKLTFANIPDVEKLLSELTRDAKNKDILRKHSFDLVEAHNLTVPDREYIRQIACRILSRRIYVIKKPVYGQGPKRDPHPVSKRIYRRIGTAGYGFKSVYSPVTSPGCVPYHATREAPTIPLKTIDVQYLDSLGNPLKGVKFQAQSVDAAGKPDGGYLVNGVTNGGGLGHVDGVPRWVNRIQYYFEDDPGPFKIREKPSKTPDIEKTQFTFDKFIEWIWGAQQGDFNDNQSVSQIAVNTVLGVLPIVDQVLDARDIVAGLQDMIEFYSREESLRHDQAEYPDFLGFSFETWMWLDLFLIAAGCIPEVGSIVKGLLRIVINCFKDNLKRVTGTLSAKNAKMLWEQAIRLLNYFGFSGGHAHRWLKTFPGNLGQWMDRSAHHIRTGLDAIDDILKKAEETVNSRIAHNLLGHEEAAQRVARIQTIQKAVGMAYARLDQMKIKLNKWLREKIIVMLGGKHRFEKIGATGTRGNPVVNIRQQAIECPPNGDYRLKKRSAGTAPGPEPPFPAEPSNTASTVDAQMKQAVENSKNPAAHQVETDKGDPVNCLTGAVVGRFEDFVMPGRIPLIWQRHYSSQSSYDGVCGLCWQTPADARLTIEPCGLVTFCDGTPGGTVFESVPQTLPVLSVGNGAMLIRESGQFQVRLKSGLTYHFFLPVFLPETFPGEIPLTRITDNHGNYIHFARQFGQLALISNNAGQIIEVTNKESRISEMRLRRDGSEARLLVRYEYDSANHLCSVYDALNHPHHFFYEQDRLIRHTNRKGMSFYYEYQGDKCIHTCGDDGVYDYRFDYDPLQRHTRVTNSLGFSETYYYDKNGTPQKIEDHQGRVTVYKYDKAGHPHAVIDPTGRRTRYDYDRYGNLLKIIRPDNTSVEITYDLRHHPIEIKDPQGHLWRQQWSTSGLLQCQTAPLGTVTTYTYNTQGDLIAITDPNGHKTLFEKDRQGNTIALTDAAGNRSGFVWDDSGNVIESIDPAGKKTAYVYDAKSRLTGVQTATGQRITCSYDAADNLIQYTDETGRITHLEYTGTNEVKRRIAPDGTVVTYHYDTEDQLIGIQNEQGASCLLKRDHAGRIIEETDYWGQTRHYAYDPLGNLATAIDPLGRKTRFKFDIMDRLKYKILADGSIESFKYDANGNLIRHENPAARVARTFDDQNRLIREDQPNGHVAYTYDASGNLIRRTSSLGNDIAYAYDALNNVTTIGINGQPAATISRYQNGALLKESLADITRSYEYTLQGRLSLQNIQSPHARIERRYTYDVLGNLLGKKDSVKGDHYFTYDSQGRIGEHIDPTGKLKKFLYDPAGNLLKPVPTPTGVKTDRLMANNGTTYRFNAAGNLVERTSPADQSLFCWDANDRLAQVFHKDAPPIRMTYDATGRRLSKETNGTKTTFIWDGDRILADGTSQITSREFVFYPNSFEPLAIIDNDKKIYYFHNDLVGLPQEITDSQGNTLWSATYDALGRCESLQADRIDNPIRMQGQYADDELGLYYNRYRYYDPNSCSFISQDPLRLAAGTNLYRYVPNVWGWVDPLGLSCRKEGTSKSAGRTFAHGTSMDSIDNIIANGFDEDAAKFFSKGGSVNSPGSFFTMEVPPKKHLQGAYEFGLRHAEQPAVLLTEIPDSIFQKLLRDGSVRVRTVPGADDLIETIFDPKSYSTLNNFADFSIIDPYKRR